MTKVIFNYKGIETEMQCNINEKLKDIFIKYTNKEGIDISNLNYFFIYNGNKVNDNLLLSEIINEADKQRNIMNILVDDNNKTIKKKFIIKSKEIICPTCGENILIKINEYKINFFNCKNNHEIENIKLNEYENIENIDISKIICNKCKKNNKSNTYHNEFYRCNICKINLCPLCKSNHNPNHKIINYDSKNYICEIHNINYNKYCKKCKLNICVHCFKAHKNHSIANYEDIILNEVDNKKEINKFKEYIDKLKRYLKETTEKFNKIKENIDLYYKIYDNIINNYNCENINYEILYNINEFNRYNNDIIKDINEIINDYNINNKINEIINKMDNINYKEYKDKINYKFEKDPNKLKYKYEITKTNDYDSVNDVFEVFISYKDNKEYVVSPNIDNFNLDIFTFLDNKEKINSLEGHEDSVLTVRYFINNKNHNEYLISADDKKIVIIWDITNNYNIKYKIDTKYNNDIFSCLLVFPDNNNDNYIITSTSSKSNVYDESATKIYSLNNGNFIKYIKNTKNIEIYYLLSWYNKNNNKYYIIQLGNKKIIICNLLDDELYSELINQNEDYHNSGFIYNLDNNDYLCVSSTNGYINIWDLYNKNLFKVINTNNCRLYHIIQWNIKYILVADYDNNCFKIINLENSEIKDIKNNVNAGIICIKKIYHPLYGESLLSADEDKSIKLWSI